MREKERRIGLFKAEQGSCGGEGLKNQKHRQSFAFIQGAIKIKTLAQPTRSAGIFAFICFPRATLIRGEASVQSKVCLGN